MLRAGVGSLSFLGAARFGTAAIWRRISSVSRFWYVLLRSTGATGVSPAGVGLLTLVAAHQFARC